MEIYRRIVWGNFIDSLFILVRWKNGKYYWREAFENIDAPLIRLECRNKHHWKWYDEHAMRYSYFYPFKESDLNQ